MAIKLKKLKKPPKHHFPLQAQRRYIKGLHRQFENLKEGIKAKIIPNIAGWNQENKNLKGDSWSDDINSVVNDLYLTFGRQMEDYVKTELDNIAKLTGDFNKKEWTKITKLVLGVDLFRAEPWLRDMMKSWVNKNATLIRNLQEETFKNITNVLSEGIEQGEKNTTIAKRLISETDLKALKPTDSKVSAIKKAKNRAELIAVDQIGKLNGQLTEQRQKDIGVESYIWRNVRDRRVRGNPIGLYPNSRYNHWEREGKVYSWGNPPPDGHPGFPVRCRCYAEANFSSIKGLEEIFNVKG